jgi:hypothetical protein
MKKDPAEEASAALSDGGGEHCLMAPPSILVESIEESSVTLRNPEDGSRLRLTRAVYELFRPFYRPTTIAAVLPPGTPRRERKVACLGRLADQGFLVRPSTVIPDIG